MSPPTAAEIIQASSHQETCSFPLMMVVFDNGAACGRRIRIRYIASDACKGGSIDVKVVNYRPSTLSFTLPNEAWDEIVCSRKVGSVNIEYVWI